MDKNEKKWFNQLLADRIQMVLEKNLSKRKSSNLDAVENKAEHIIQNLPLKDRECIEAYIDGMMALSATQEELLYKAGVIDGISIVLSIWK